MICKEEHNSLYDSMQSFYHVRGDLETKLRCEDET